MWIASLSKQVTGYAALRLVFRAATGHEHPVFLWA